MGTHKPSYHELLLPQDRACWATLRGLRTERIPQLSQRPITARAQEPSAGDLRRVALAAWLFQGNQGQTDRQAQLPDGTSLAGGVGRLLAAGNSERQ